METFINGIGVTGGFGCGVNDLIDCLNRDTTPSLTSPGENGSEKYYPSYIADISYLTTVVPKRELRRIDRFSQLALTGAYLAINNAGTDSLDDQETGLVICSGYGSAKTTFSFLDSLIDYGDACASPTLFSNSVHNAAAGHISILLGIEGPCLTVSQFKMSVPAALLSAIQWLKEDRVERVLFGAVDEYCDVLGYCYQRFYGRGRGGNTAMTPLVPDNQSALPGEGSAFFLLSKAKPAEKGYGSISSVKIGNVTDKEMNLPEDSFFILNADGHKECDKSYFDIIPPGRLVSCYTPLYGSMPTGTAFDMAIGSISLKESILFSSPESVGDIENQKVLRERCTNDKTNISCVNIGKQGELSVITLSK